MMFAVPSEPYEIDDDFVNALNLLLNQHEEQLNNFPMEEIQLKIPVYNIVVFKLPLMHLSVETESCEVHVGAGDHQFKELLVVHLALRVLCVCLEDYFEVIEAELICDLEVLKELEEVVDCYDALFSVIDCVEEVLGVKLRILS